MRWSDQCFYYQKLLDRFLVPGGASWDIQDNAEQPKWRRRETAPNKASKKRGAKSMKN